LDEEFTAEEEDKLLRIAQRRYDITPVSSTQAPKRRRWFGERRFICFVCGADLPETELGGIIHGKKVCKDCLPFISEREIGRLIKFDRMHRQRV